MGHLLTRAPHKYCPELAPCALRTDEQSKGRNVIPILVAVIELKFLLGGQLESTLVFILNCNYCLLIRGKMSSW